MRKLVTCALCCLFLSSFALEYGYQEVLFNEEDYFEKDRFVINNFFPEIKLSDFLDVYKDTVALSSEDQQNTIHIEIADKNWKALMSHYLSENRFVGRQYYPILATFVHDGIQEKVSGEIKHRGNYSTKSLKFGFRFDLDQALQNGVFAGKKRIITRHLMFDRTGTNEYVYFQGYKDLHKQILSYSPMMVDLEYYWVFINDKPYGYYLVMNDSKDELIETRNGEKYDKDTDCIVKAKAWKSDYSANMVYHEEFEDFAFFNEMYRVEEGDEQACYQDFLQLMKDVRDKNMDALNVKIADWDQISFYAHYQDLTENKAGVFQNYLLIKHKGQWEISPWDGDLTFLMDARIDESVVRENPLFDLAYDQSSINFDEQDSRLYLGKLLKQAFNDHADFIHLDRKIWSPYIPKDEQYISETYYKYVTGEFASKEIRRYISHLFTETYKYFIVRN